MITIAELKRLLLLVRPEKYDSTEGLDVFRQLLQEDATGHVLRFLNREFQKADGEVRASLAFVIAEHNCASGDLRNLKILAATDDSAVKESVLNGLWGQPADSVMGNGIVDLAIEAVDHSSPGVRTQACYVLQNQCGWKVDVSAAIGPLIRLQADSEARVRHQAAYALGNLAKGRYDVSSALPQLRRNVKHADIYVREAAAWALWQLSRRKHDIAKAVPELVWLLGSMDENDGPRKQASGALLNHANKSAANAADVRKRVKNSKLDESRKEIARFVRKLAEFE